MTRTRLLDGRLKFRHLVLMDALVRQGSVNGAAAELHFTQPVATRGLQELEEILGAQLFTRSARGVTPTVYGEAFVGHARVVLAQVQQADSHISELTDAQRGTVVVGTHLVGSNVLIPKAIAAVKLERPHLTVIVRENTPEALLVELEAARIDLIVGRLTASSDEHAERRWLYDESINLVVRGGHPLAGSGSVSLAELSDFPWILPGTETALRAELEQFFARHDLALPRNRVETTSFLTARQLLIDSNMIAALPSLIIRDEPRLVHLPVALDLVGHGVGLTIAANRVPNPSTQMLIQCLGAIATELVPRS